ncbi:Ras-related protein Rab-12 [Geodia barretti]|uniref:Ras-related protein Rab-12 n=1 Tax=Geodia barretti TaxID=519541 RepID=A0AA35U2W3_GEOBA|nr:Ras-related protein Rab-12 [Geodia barretti]
MNVARPSAEDLTKALKVNPESGNILIKVVLCGPVSGKTTLVYRFTTGRSRAGMTPATIGAQFFRKAVSVSGETVELQMWDTGAYLTALHGLNSSKLLTVYLTKAHGVVLVYDITHMESFRDLRDRVKYIQKCVHEETEFVLMGTKKDLEAGREVSRELGETFAEERGFHFFEASATTGENFNELFHCLAEQIVRKKRQSEEDGRISLSSVRQSRNNHRSQCF